MRQHLRTSAAILLSTALLCACGKNITAINNNPAKYDGRDITITAVVKQSLNVPKTDNQQPVILYQIDDNSSQSGKNLIWVVRGQESSQKSLMPNASHRITVKGTVQKEQVINSRRYAPVLIEKSAQEEIPKNAPGDFG